MLCLGKRMFPMLLYDLLRQFDPSLELQLIPNVTVTGVQEDSRLVQPGHVFVARGGSKSDGRAYLADAKARGAVAAVVPAGTMNCPLPFIQVAHPASAASVLA